ncbi:universal stress protein [Aeromicrobium sp.]|uniref:universal stress protein n=1 Tax=Aeromicrobium sp. TaxID=1871063 RepID=UPI003D6A4F16
MSNRPVVVGLKRHQPAVLRHALDEARRLGTYVRVAHVVPRAELTRLHGARPPFLEQVRRAVENEVDAPRVDYFTWWGDPAEVLAVESRDACLLVVGGDELPWITKLAGGEVARKVSLTAHCPVEVVPSEDLNPNRVGGVVVAVDGAGPVDGPLLYAFQSAHARHETLQIVTAAGSPDDRVGREARRQRLEDVVGRGQSMFPDVHVLPAVDAEHGVAACLLATQHASLLVLGRPIDHHAPWSPLGVAGRVLRRAKSPVAVVPLNQAIALTGVA